MNCPKCGKTIKDNSKFCGYCGKKFKNSVTSMTRTDMKVIKYRAPEKNKNEEITQLKAEIENLKKESSEISAKAVTLAVPTNVPNNATAKCRYCGSTSLQVVKQGVSVGKAVTGALLIGPLGLAAGAAGMSNNKIICLNCRREQ